MRYQTQAASGKGRNSTLCIGRVSHLLGRIVAGGRTEDVGVERHVDGGAELAPVLAGPAGSGAWARHAQKQQQECGRTDPTSRHGQQRRQGLLSSSVSCSASWFRPRNGISAPRRTDLVGGLVKVGLDGSEEGIEMEYAHPGVLGGRLGIKLENETGDDGSWMGSWFEHACSGSSQRVTCNNDI
jgi:hypothetical protein